MRNIIITGGGMVNKGAQAMTLIAVNELKKRWPEHKIYLYSPSDLENKNLDKSVFAFDFIGWYPLKFAHCQNNPLLRLVSLLRSKNELLEAERIYKNCDGIFDISGYALGSDWDAKICNDFLDVIEYAYYFGIPVYLMPQSFGPFDFGEKHPGIDRRCKKLLPYCKVILAREQEGYDALVEKYALTNVSLVPDLVLNNKGIDLKSVFKEIPAFDIPEIGPDSIAVVPNGRNLSVGNDEEVFSLYSAAIRRGLEQGKTVYLLHHATGDAKICEKLKDMFADEERVVLLSKEFSCLEFNEIVKHFDYLVASRFHSIVHAFKNGVPCIAVGWAKKYEDLLSAFGQEEYLFDVRNSPDEKKLAEAMDNLDKNKADCTQKILDILLDVQKENVFDCIDI